MNKKLKVGIIGAGFGGLAAAYTLSKHGFEVSVFEGEEIPGGLAIGFEKDNWKWGLERHYHHWFTNDHSVLNLAKQIGHKVVITRPKTSTFVNGKIYQLDSPISLLKFSEIPLVDRIRTGLVLAFLKFTPDWKTLEKITAKDFLLHFGGKETWKVLWEPLFIGKFQNFANKVPASWFWARIKKRTQSLAYPERGFLDFAKNLESRIRKSQGKFFYGSIVKEINKNKDKIILKTEKKVYKFDKVICTLPSPLFLNITKSLPRSYVNNFINLKGLGAVNLVLSLNKQFMTDGTYWLNINEIKHPYLAVVEHTNFMDKENYGNNHLIYVGNYLPHEHVYFNKEADDLIKEFLPFLQKINPDFRRDWINEAWVFKARFAQPVIPLNFSKNVPDFETPIKGLYLCNIQQVYPWDRGTNYAVENGEKVADMIIKDNL